MPRGLGCRVLVGALLGSLGCDKLLGIREQSVPGDADYSPPYDSPTSCNLACSGLTPVCEQGVCTACDSDAECGSGACSLGRQLRRRKRPRLRIADRCKCR